MSTIDEQIDRLVTLLVDRHVRTEEESEVFANELDTDQLEQTIKAARNPAAWRDFTGTRLVAPGTKGPQL